MPLYDYACENCPHKDIEVYPMSTPSRVQCPRCGKYAYVKQISPIHTSMQEYHTPIEMFSIAMEDQKEIREFARKCPEIQISDDPNDEMYGVPIAKSRMAKLQALKEAKFIEKN